MAALCLRDGKNGTEVLMITSRDTGRWIIPKGGRMKGKNGLQAARIEAWEEAGVKSAKARPDSMGKYRYEKRYKNGRSRSVRVKVYRMDVKTMSNRFPEMSQRRRAWFSPKAAARLVAEPEQRKLLRRI